MDDTPREKFLRKSIALLGKLAELRGVLTKEGRWDLVAKLDEIIGDIDGLREDAEREWE